ncbi:MAG: T9SS type A sorting domain-containing protein [Bacteroidetes bacterium]|nr:T9SS type A sorting domain-containing protein [Bacteroidota bacterium]
MKKINMKKINLILLFLLYCGISEAGTWLPTGSLASNCAIFTMTGTTGGDVIISDYNSMLQKKSAGSMTWTPAGLSGRKVRYLTTLQNGDIYAISGTGSYIASSTSMIHRSTDGGTTWQDLFSRNFPFNNMVGGAMTVMQDGSYLAAIPVQKGPTIGNIVWTLVYKSTDNGTTWFAKDSNQTGEPKGMITVGDNKVFLGSTEDGVYYSATGGDHWWPIDTTTHFFGTRYTMDIVKSREGTIFYTEGAKVRRSTDNGLHTTILVTPSPSSSINAICVESDNEMYIATDDKKVYKSTNMGDTWQVMTTGLPGAANVYSLKIIDGKLFAGTYAYGVFYYEPDAVGVQNGSETASSFALNQNYPNPFNPTTKISFSIIKSSFVNLSVYDMLGKKVSEIVNGVKANGNYEVTFDASSLSGGVYFYKLQTEDFSEIKKMTLIK